MNGPSPKRAAVAGLAALAASWLCLSLCEAIAVAVESGPGGVLAPFAALRVAAVWTARLGAPVWLYAAALALAAVAAGPRRRALAVSVAVACAAIAVYAHAVVLGSYAAFMWYPPFLAASAALAVVLALGHVDASAPFAAASSPRRVLRASWPAIGLLGAAAVHAANHRLFGGMYPTLHLAALLWTAALLQLGLFALFARRPRVGRPKALAVGAAALAAALAVPAALAPRALVDKAFEAAASSNALGEARLVGLSFDPRSEDVRKGPLPPEEDAEALFAKASRFPPLPEGFRLEDYNVLLVTSEATRYDQTSLYDPALRTTPFLERLVSEGGALSFGRAFAPSSGTLHSLAGLLCMTFPSMTRLETWGKAWHGLLTDAEETVPELFARAGYDTFTASHDHKGAFQTTITGLHQGFASKRFVYETGVGEDSASTDTKVAEIAIEELRKRAGGGRRFFGWVFFASPHFDYFAHYDDMPRETDLERYRQEIRFVDSQLGRVVEALRGMGILDRTIIAYAGDHGEEFREHGGTHHKTTVYSESTWVPLVVRVPGLGGGRVDAPTSLAYLFPWLALGGPPPLRDAALSRLGNDIGPMMRATDGAVIVELIGHDRMMSSLVYGSRKLNYSFISNRIELFDTRADVLEKRDLLRRRPELEAGARAAVERYLRVRAARRRYTLDPENDR